MTSLSNNSTDIVRLLYGLQNTMIILYPLYCHLDKNIYWIINILLYQNYYHSMFLDFQNQHPKSNTADTDT